jgi:hypothetical protein
MNSSWGNFRKTFKQFSWENFSSFLVMHVCVEEGLGIKQNVNGKYFESAQGVHEEVLGFKMGMEML